MFELCEVLFGGLMFFLVIFYIVRWIRSRIYDFIFLMNLGFKCLGIFIKYNNMSIIG